MERPVRRDADLVHLAAIGLLAEVVRHFAESTGNVTRGDARDHADRDRSTFNGVVGEIDVVGIDRGFVR